MNPAAPVTRIDLATRISCPFLWDFSGLLGRGPIRWGASERCPSGLRSATGNRVRAARCVAGSNPALSADARPGSSGPARALVEDAGDEILASQHLLRGAGEADVIARVLREEHLVARRDAFHLGADGSDDAAAALRLEARRQD